MNTEDFQRKLKSIEETGASAARKNSPVAGVFDASATIAQYTNQIAQQKIATEIENAKVSAESPEDLVKKIDAITQNNPVLSKFASRELTVAQLNAEDMTKRQKVAQQDMRESAHFTQIAGMMPYFSNSQDYMAYVNAQNNADPNKDNRSKNWAFKNEMLKDSADMFYQQKSFGQSALSLSNIVESQVEQLGGITDKNKAEGLAKVMMEFANTTTTEDISKARVSSAIYSYLKDNAKDTKELDSFIEAGYIDKDSEKEKYLRSAISGKVAFNEQVRQGIVLQEETNHFNNTTRFGFITDRKYSDPNLEKLRKLVEKNNKTIMSLTIQEAINALSALPDGEDKNILANMLVQRKELVTKDPVEFYIFANGLPEDQAEALRTFVPIEKDAQGNLEANTSGSLNFIRIRADATEKASIATGIASANVLSGDTQVQMHEAFSALTASEQHAYAGRVSEALMPYQLPPQALSSVLGDKNLNTFSSVRLYSPPKANEWLRNYYALQSSHNKSTTKFDYGKSVLAPYLNQDGKVLPPHITDIATTYVLPLVPKVLDPKNKTVLQSNITSKITVTTVDSKAIIGNENIALPKGGIKFLEIALKEERALQNYVEKIEPGASRKLNKLSDYQQYFVITQRDFQSFVVYSSDGSIVVPIFLG